nr:MAG TPA: hypothetical protein [Caudoviricetes sp.]
MFAAKRKEYGKFPSYSLRGRRFNDWKARYLYEIWKYSLVSII